jgi:ribosomal-protein-alanine N-acetyltransferase
MTPADMAATHAAAFTQSRPWRAEEFASLLENRFCHAVGEAACFALIRVVADEAELLTIATRPESQRQGKARACMTLFHDKARSLGATRAFLEVAADNTPARAVYAACGYVTSGTRPGYYPRPDGAASDALLMTRVLTRP